MTKPNRRRQRVFAPLMAKQQRWPTAALAGLAVAVAVTCVLAAVALTHAPIESVSPPRRSAEEWDALRREQEAARRWERQKEDSESARAYEAAMAREREMRRVVRDEIENGRR